MTTSALRLAGPVIRTRVLGPGDRLAIWVQGCPFRCAGCISPDTHALDLGTEVSVGDLVDELCTHSDVEGLTISGGEPFAQPAALADLLERLRARMAWSFMCYTGHLLSDLVGRDERDIHRVLDLVDVLVDGPYVEALHTSLRWRGSTNQTVHFLTPRYRHLRPMLDDEGVWVETRIDASNGVRFVGIPPRGFVPAMRRAMQARGITLQKGRV